MTGPDFFRNDDEEEKGESSSASASAMMMKFLDARTVLIFGGIDQKLAERVATQLLYLDHINHDPIKLIINSPGGHVESGDTIHDLIQFIASPVAVIGTGWVASAGTHIFLGAPKERRFCLPNTRLPRAFSSTSLRAARAAKRATLRSRRRKSSRCANDWAALSPNAPASRSNAS
jgi:ATP-dependent Clp protease, protease subunit